MLEMKYGWKFLAGLLVSLIDLALLWAPSSTSPTPSVEPQRRHEFPSWSWAKWIGGVDYELVPSTGLISKLESIYLEDEVGCWELTDRIREFSINRNQTSNILKSKPIRQDQASILHFRGFTVPFTKFRIEKANKHHYYTQDHIFQGLSYQLTALVLDQDGHHCGTLYGIEQSSIENSHEIELEFILLSATYRHSRTLQYAGSYLDLGQLGLRPDTYGQSGLYEGKVYDDKYFGMSRWSVLNVMLVSVKDGSSERLAIGQIHAKAWQSANPTQKRVKLI
jgi:hypothetical protein